MTSSSATPTAIVLSFDHREQSDTRTFTATVDS